MPAAAPPPAAPAAAPSEGWSPARRVLFRFAFVYLGLYGISGMLGMLPSVPVVSAKLAEFWSDLVPRVAKAFDLTLVRRPTGSGDTLFAFVQVGLNACAALTLTVLWTFVAGRRGSYRRMHDLLRVFLRFLLGASLLLYGIVKVFRLQFPPPDPLLLLQTYADSSPMGLLWRFMRISGPYTVASGIAEVLAGLLLFFRRTTLLGALFAMGVLANVALLNYCYDVPVKLGSTHLFAIALFLALPDLRRLLAFFVTNRAVAPADLRPAWPGRPLGVLGFVIKLGVVGWLLSALLPSNYRAWRARQATSHALDGLYRVASFTRQNVVLPPLTTDAKRWNHFALDLSGPMPALVVRTMTGDFVWHAIRREAPSTGSRPASASMPSSAPATSSTSQPDERVRGVLRLATGSGAFAASAGSLRYEVREDGRLLLAGRIQGTELAIEAEPVPAEKLRVLATGFRWVQEFPENR